MNANSEIFSEKLSKLARQAGVDAAFRSQYESNVNSAITCLNDSLTCGYLDETKLQIELALYYLKLIIQLDKENKDATL